MTTTERAVLAYLDEHGPDHISGIARRCDLPLADTATTVVRLAHAHTINPTAGTTHDRRRGWAINPKATTP